MYETMRLEDGRVAAFLEWGGSGPSAHFYHANGYPPGVYHPLLERLSAGLSLSTLAMRPLWPDAPASPPPSLRWSDYADDLIQYLDARGGEPVIGIGHSMGATATVIAAAKRPDLFSRLVLIEPAAVPEWVARMARVVPFAPRRHLFEPGRSTLRRTDTWPDRAAFAARCRQWRSLSLLNEEGLEAFIAHAVVEQARGAVGLAFPRAWEAHNYLCPPGMEPALSAVRCPVLVLRGEPSVFFSEAMWARWSRAHPRHELHRLDGFGHLLPMEAPEVCAGLVLAAMLRAPRPQRLSGSGRGTSPATRHAPA